MSPRAQSPAQPSAVATPPPAAPSPIASMLLTTESSAQPPAASTHSLPHLHLHQRSVRRLVLPRLALHTSRLPGCNQPNGRQIAPTAASFHTSTFFAIMAALVLPVSPLFPTQSASEPVLPPLLLPTLNPRTVFFSVIGSVLLCVPEYIFNP